MKNLIDFLAKMCHYAQEHVHDPDAWNHDDLEMYMTCTDFQVACFLAQNTRFGNGGVECGVVFDELCSMPPIEEEGWRHIIEDRIQVYGGLKPQEVKGVLVFHAGSCLEQNGPDACVLRFTPEQFEKYKELCKEEAEDWEKFQEKYEEYDAAPVELAPLLVPGECKEVTHCVTVESYYGSYVTNNFSELEPIN